MKVRWYSPSSASIRCSSSLVPRVTTARACVSPRVNSAEPCARGRMPTSHVIGRMSAGPRPSARLPLSRIILRTSVYSRLWNTSFTWRSRSGSSSFLKASTAVAMISATRSWRALLLGMRIASRIFAAVSVSTAAADADHVGGAGLVRRDDRGDHLGLVVPPLGEQWPDRPINQTTRELLALRRLAFPLKVAARDLARGIGLLLIVHGQRKEIDVLLASLPSHGRGQHIRVAVRGQDRAIGLLGQAPGFQPKRAARYFELHCLRHGSSLSFVL